jgi:hypothetical protein
MSRYPNASTEPLEIIRVNECDADYNLATKRFQALWNEIECLRELTRKVLDHQNKYELEDALGELAKHLNTASG